MYTMCAAERAYELYVMIYQKKSSLRFANDLRVTDRTVPLESTVHTAPLVSLARMREAFFGGKQKHDSHDATRAGVSALAR